MIFFLLLLSLSTASADFDFENSFNLLPLTKTAKKHFTNIQNGTFRFFLTVDCLQIIEKKSPFGLPSTCWAQNPDAPYGLIYLPMHVDEIPDVYTGYPLQDELNQNAVWHLRQNEAIILLGRTPPKCQYFGFTNYLYSRYLGTEFVPNHRLNPIDGRSCLPGSENERCEFFASLSDTVNFDRGLDLDSEEVPYDESFALILSPSKRATQRATEALLEAAVPLSRITNYSFPGHTLNLGDDTHADTFTTILRTAFFSNITDQENFFSSTPFKVMRIELNTEDGNSLFMKNAYVPRETGVSHDGTLAGLSLSEMKETVIKLARLVKTNVLKSSRSTDGDWDIVETGFTSGEPDSGDVCVDQGFRCLADCRDTLYPFTIDIYDRSVYCSILNDPCLRTDNRTGCEIVENLSDAYLCRSTQQGILDNDINDSIYIVGVNHKKTNMSEYSSVAIYDLKYLWGVESVGDSLLEGSAAQYVNQGDLDADPKLQKALPYLYAYKFKRMCQLEEVGCLSVPWKVDVHSESQLFIPLSHSVGFAERMYDNPISHVGPSTTEIVMPIHLHLKKTEQKRMQT